MSDSVAVPAFMNTETDVLCPIATGLVEETTDQEITVDFRLLVVLILAGFAPLPVREGIPSFKYSGGQTSTSSSLLLRNRV